MLDTTQTQETLVEVNNIEVIYNHVILVLKGVSLSVPKGGITALLGGNGAGKTTTLKAISNLLHSERGEVTKGSIEYRGEAVAKVASHWYGAQLDRRPQKVRSEALSATAPRSSRADAS